MWKVEDDNSLSDKILIVSVDGISKELAPGEELHLLPGESVCVEPRTYHQFWALEGHGSTLTVEVSSTCNDLTDNFWYLSNNRFPPIEEDEPRKFLLCGEY
jgi:D-lyxose ketol-isomerase